MKCPNCGQYKVVSSKVQATALMFAVPGTLFWIGFLFPPIWIAIPISFFLGFLMLIAKTVYVCGNCRYRLKDHEIKS